MSGKANGVMGVMRPRPSGIFNGTITIGETHEKCKYTLSI